MRLFAVLFLFCGSAGLASPPAAPDGTLLFKSREEIEVVRRPDHPLLQTFLPDSFVAVIRRFEASKTDLERISVFSLPLRAGHSLDYDTCMAAVSKAMDLPSLPDAKLKVEPYSTSRGIACEATVTRDPKKKTLGRLAEIVVYNSKAYLFLVPYRGPASVGVAREFRDFLAELK